MKTNGIKDDEKGNEEEGITHKGCDLSSQISWCEGSSVCTLSAVNK